MMLDVEVLECGERGARLGEIGVRGALCVGPWMLEGSYLII